jgi:Mce-associated membrane protein
LLLAAVVALGVFGVPYVRALTTDRTTAEMRDDALVGAQQVAINLNNADSANLDQSIENMRSSVTGDEMTTYLQTVQDSITDELRNSGSKADTEVVQSALTELNTDDRTATALVVVRVTTTQGNQFVKNQLGMRLGMVEVDGVWKAQSADPIGSRLDLGSGTLPAADGSTPAPDATPAPGSGTEAPASGAPAPTTEGGDSGGQ